MPPIFYIMLRYFDWHWHWTYTNISKTTLMYWCIVLFFFNIYIYHSNLYLKKTNDWICPTLSIQSIYQSINISKYELINQYYQRIEQRINIWLHNKLICIWTKYNIFFNQLSTRVSIISTGTNSFTLLLNISLMNSTQVSTKWSTID